MANGARAEGMGGRGVVMGGGVERMESAMSLFHIWSPSVESFPLCRPEGD